MVHLKMGDPWKRRFLLETTISRFHVNFWEGRFYTHLNRTFHEPFQFLTSILTIAAVPDLCVAYPIGKKESFAIVGSELGIYSTGVMMNYQPKQCIIVREIPKVP